MNRSVTSPFRVLTRLLATLALVSFLPLFPSTAIASPFSRLW